MKKTLLHAALFAAVTPAMASGVKVVGTLPVVVDQPHRQARSVDSMRVQPPKIVSLLKVQLSSDAKSALSKRVHRVLNGKKSLKVATNKQSLPSEMQLGMNDVPVLDQGMHGSCVTFANSGALDALIGKGDYVSQLCSLALGKYLEEQDYNYPSGWDGSWGPIVVSQFFNYGVVSMDNQHQNSCGGLSEYPVGSYATGSAMTANDYQNISENISNTLDWTSIVSTDEALSKTKSISPDEVLDQVKTSLATGSRVTFGVLLDVYYGSNGAVGTHNSYHDTWMLTPEIEQDAQDGYINAGHEMIITGYDDNAEVRADDGTVNKGLLTLRNSWGETAGDNGNYYMSYDHFKALALEAQSLHTK